MGSARERWRSVCDGDFGRGPRLAVPTLEGRTGSLSRPGGRDGDPGLFYPPNRLQSKTSPACIGPVRLVLLVLLSLLGH